MGEVVKLVQKQNNMQCLCAPPIAFYTAGNEYTLEGKGSEFVAVKEDDSCLCQKICFPSMRAYSSEIKSSSSGTTYKAQRELSCGQITGILCPYCMPTVSLKDGSGNVVGIIE